MGLASGECRKMPLHGYSYALPGWDGVHQVWIVELLYCIKPRLPAGYRAYIGTTPTFAIGAPAEQRPDLGVRDWPEPAHTRSACTVTQVREPVTRGVPGTRKSQSARSPGTRPCSSSSRGD